MLQDLASRDVPRTVSLAQALQFATNVCQDTQLTNPMHQFFALLVSPTAELARKANHQSVSVVELDFTSTEEPVPNAHQNAQNVTPKDASPASQDFT
jgi:hypothetical protein